jgi:thiamine pyrophosphokinase
MTSSLTVIFANGELLDPAGARELALRADVLVAADGGARHIRACGLHPGLVIGDLDSLTESEVEALRDGGSEILRFPVEKNETDLELALLETVRRGYDRIRVVAATGGRLDQLLANVFLLALPELFGCDVRLVDGPEEAFLIRGTGEIIGKPGEIVSLLPLFGPAVGIRTQGLRYPLEDEALFPERSRGVSNELMGERAVVDVADGTLLCVHRRS